MTKKILAIALALTTACSFTAFAAEAPAEAVEENAELPAIDASTIPGIDDGVLTVAMECAYAPYNWAQPDDSNDAVPIKDSMLYANGYDVMTAKNICEYLGVELEVVQLDWDSLIPAVQAGVVDAVIAGQSMTAERMESVNFAGPYLYASIVCVTKADSAYANAKGLADLAGGSCTSQSGTIWYDSCLPQIKDADIQSPAESAPAMTMAVASGTVDFICTDMPTAQAALIAYPDLVILDFSGSEDDFEVSDEDINIGVSVSKENTALCEAIDAYLATLTADDFNALMASAIEIQPLTE